MEQVRYEQQRKSLMYFESLGRLYLMQNSAELERDDELLAQLNAFNKYIDVTYQYHYLTSYSE